MYVGCTLQILELPLGAHTMLCSVLLGLLQSTLKAPRFLGIVAPVTFISETREKDPVFAQLT